MDGAHLQLLREACDADDHERIETLLNDLPTEQDIAHAMRFVLQRFDGSAAVVRYLLPFLEWCLTHDRELAAGLLRRCRYASDTVPGLREAASRLVYEQVIEPDEPRWRRQFEANHARLAPHVRRMPPAASDFDTVARSLVHLPFDGEQHPVIAGSAFEGCLMVDVTDVEAIRTFAAEHLCYLVFEDVDKFNAFLLQDLSPIDSALERFRLLVFAGRDLAYLRRQLGNTRLRLPYTVQSASAEQAQEYEAILRSVSNERAAALQTWVRAIESYYGQITPRYHQRLFTLEPRQIKVLVITTIHSFITQYIARAWFEAFRELGYTTRLLVESDRHEEVDSTSVCEALYDFRPDIVYNINVAVGDVVPGEKTRRALLWLLRRRDMTSVDNGVPYEHNMFALQMLGYWIEDAIRVGFEPGRVQFVPDGVDTTTFTPPVWRAVRRFDCDVVSVNNASLTGAELVLRTVTQPQMRPVVVRLFEIMEELATQGHYIFHSARVGPYLDELLAPTGLVLDPTARDFIAMHAVSFVVAWYRRKNIEWIVEAGITRNIQVWGLGWERYPNMRPYHRGLAQHGKHLSSIYRYSRIAISDQATNELHERNFEIMASGGFPLVKRVYPEVGERVERITDYLEENKEVVMYYDKEDYLQKIAYYLEHPQQRDDIAAAGMARVREGFSATAMCRQAMERVRQYFVPGA